MDTLDAPAQITVTPDTVKEAQHATTQDLQHATLHLRTQNGQDIPLPTSLTRTLMAALRSLASNGAVTVSELPEELSSTTAADVIGVSRPTVMKWAANGELTSHKVGTHTRFRREDVLAFKTDRLERQRAAFQSLRDLEMEHDILD